MGRVGAGDEGDANVLMSFPGWAKAQDKQRLPISEEGYNEYVQRQRKREAEIFSEDHATEEWFLDRYDSSRVKERREARAAAAKEAADRLQSLVAKLPAQVPKAAPAAWSGESVGAPSDSVPDDGPLGQLQGILPDLDGGAPAKHVPVAVALRRVPLAVTRAELQAAVLAALPNTDESKARVVLGGPASARKTPTLDRDGWVLDLTPDERTALLAAKTLRVTVADRPAQITVVPLPTTSKLVADRAGVWAVKADLPRALALARALDSGRGIEMGLDSLLATDGMTRYLAAAPEHDLGSDEKLKESAQRLARDKRKLDVAIGYLREVHLVCFYSAAVPDDEAGLLAMAWLPRARDAPAREAFEDELRELVQVTGDLPADKREDPAALEAALLEAAETRAKSNIEALDALLREHEAEEASKRLAKAEADLAEDLALVSKAVESYCNAQTKREEANRYRCLLPPYKLFKTPEFVHKHIKKVHGENVRKVEAEARQAALKKRFEQDPCKPLPPLPAYAEPKPRTAYLREHFPHALRDAMAAKRPRGPAPIVRTIVDYSDITSA